MLRQFSGKVTDAMESDCLLWHSPADILNLTDWEIAVIDIRTNFYMY